ncbi:MAG: hypothetical protein ACK4TN_07140, partial [Brevinematales bacterium]
MGNIRLYTLVFGFLFLFRLLALGPWIEEPLFTPFQLYFYHYVIGQSLVYPLEKDQGLSLTQQVFWYRLLIWIKEILIDGITFIGMIGLVAKKEFLRKGFWKMWFFLCIVWQIAITFWLSSDITSVLTGLLLSGAAPYLVWMYGWQRQ